MKRFLLSLCMALFLLFSLPVYATEVERLSGVAIVDVDTLNVRSGPSKEYDKLGTLARDTSVEVKGIVEPDWYVIEFQGVDGYINSEYVSFTPEEEVSFSFVTGEYAVMALGVGILLVSGGLVYTFVKMRRDEDEEEGGEEIPVTDHADTNMHMGEIGYDTYRIDIDPKYFEQTMHLPQPESIYDENGVAPWKKDVYGEEETKEQPVAEQSAPDADIQTLDSKLEQASAQIAALQKEVEQLKKQQTDTI